jgi:hypothetical protein
LPISIIAVPLNNQDLRVLKNQLSDAGVGHDDEIWDIFPQSGVKQSSVRELENSDRVEYIQPVRNMGRVNSLEPVNSLQSVRTVHNLKAVHPLRSIRPVDDLQEVRAIHDVKSLDRVADIQEIVNMEEINNLEEIKSIIPVPDDKARQFLEQEGLLYDDSEERDVDDQFIYQQHDEDAKECDRILRMFGIKSLSEIKSILPVSQSGESGVTVPDYNSLEDIEYRTILPNIQISDSEEYYQNSSEDDLRSEEEVASLEGEGDERALLAKFVRRLQRQIEREEKIMTVLDQLMGMSVQRMLAIKKVRNSHKTVIELKKQKLDLLYPVFRDFPRQGVDGLDNGIVNIDEVTSMDEVENLREVNSLQLVDNVRQIDNIEEVDGHERIKSMDAVSNLAEVESVQPLDNVQKIEHIEDVVSQEEIEAIQEVTDIKPLKRVIPLTSEQAATLKRMLGQYISKY